MEAEDYIVMAMDVDFFSKVPGYSLDIIGFTGNEDDQFVHDRNYGTLKIIDGRYFSATFGEIEVSELQID